jgi:hypothetical protein
MQEYRNRVGVDDYLAAVVVLNILLCVCIGTACNGHPDRAAKRKDCDGCSDFHDLIALSICTNELFGKAYTRRIVLSSLA